MKKISINRVGVGSLAKLVGIVNAIVALAVGVVASIVATVGVIANNDFSVFGDLFAALGIALLGLVVYPLIWFAFGWLYGALIAIIWNVVLGVSGGLQIDTEEVKEAK
jgi:hypothetical protein